MWILLPFGFYSIVAKHDDAKDDSLTIRARSSSDLELLRARLLPELGAVVADAGPAYPYRARAPRDAVERALARTARELDYPNFKQAVAAYDAGRARLYHDVWSVLRRIREARPRSNGGASPTRD